MTVLVLDIGTSSARALLFDDYARPIPGALVQHKYEITTTPPGAATLDAEELRGIVEMCIDEILQHPAAKDIRIVGMATFVGNLLGVDKDGKPITPIYLYADTRSADDVETLRAGEEDGGLGWHGGTGCPIHTAYHPARLLWLWRTQPETFARVKLWTDIASYLYTHWFGTSSPCSYSVASWSGMYIRTILYFATDLLKLYIPPVQFPPATDYDNVQAGLSPRYIERWQILKDAFFCLAVGDGAAANVGAGCMDRTRIALSVGTTAAIRVTMPSQYELGYFPRGLWCYCVTADLYLVGGATSEGGNLYRWACDTLQLPSDFTDQLALRPVDGHGLTALPLLAGERSPGWSLDATGSIVGLRLSTTPLDIAQAMFEGLALRLAIIYEQLGGYVDKNSEIIASGGALSPYLAQIIADALDHPLQVTAETEITSRGVALLALKAIVAEVSLGEPPEIAYIVRQRPEAVTTLRAARERQADLYRKMIADQGSPT